MSKLSAASSKKIIAGLVDKIRQGDIRSAARACTLIENEDPDSSALLSLLYPLSGTATVVGITGPPGAGKSTLLAGLIEEAAAHGEQVGVIAVDPSSPLTGGALLADRLRIDSGQNQIYIRSVATRGTLGGLACAVFGILRVLEAMGKTMIFVETVGAGQNEIAVTQLATTTLYVTVPHLGDEIQALKAGILEVSDIFVVNKSDLGNAEMAVSQLRSILTLKDPAAAPSWTYPVLSASAAQRKGLPQIFKSILDHRAFLERTGEGMERRKKQASAELLSILERQVMIEMKSYLSGKMLDHLVHKRQNPQTLVKQILSRRSRRK